ncbi:hypothetical protein JVT61DRAFT_1705 [Boletus reticuloceps]|uniref:RING-14 protein n=1 Tax=Boletus reticuloceps TaxID=495285 RepID=A0A8I2YQN2_9AGAM|nr:hypothetical protein JVT61DRAFT_1705 [Boletus reticuloceps]
MHFSKTYAQLLLTLPPEFRNNAFEYRKLKQLINQIVLELDSLGLAPSFLRSLHDHGPEDGLAHVEEHHDGTLTVDSESVSGTSHRQTIVYEIVWNTSVLQPRLRLSSSSPSDVLTHRNPIPPTIQPVCHVNLPIPERSLSHITQALLHTPIILGDEIDQPDDLIIPLPSDMAFFQLLTSTLSSLSGYLYMLEQGFNPVLTTLAASISSTARPASFSAPRSFSPYSLAADHSMSLCPGPGGKSDLCTWREIFRLYVEAEVFESVSESTRGERSIEEVEKHFELFKGHVQEKKEYLVFPRSREAFDVFLKLNLFILNVKKFQLANSEATRKILKKHAKRTTLPIPSCLLERDASTPTASSCQPALITRPSKSLPRLLVQAIGEVLLPIIPHIDDYSCLICASIAFKPIRLCCGHFFCVRCLVKMQRRRMADCPMCRAQTVLQANPSNVDYGLLNLMADWFPIESREKQHTNEREVIQEQLEALGIADARICRIM